MKASSPAAGQPSKSSRWLGLALPLLLSLSMTGCLKKILIDGQLKGTRQGAEAINTLQDFEIARSVTQASLGQFEGMYGLAPDNTDGLFLLTKAWSGSAAAFFDDDYELAMIKGDDSLTEYNLNRVRAGYARGRYYGVKLLSAHTFGFEEAKQNQETIRAWLHKNFTQKAEAEDLLWTGFAWLSEVQAASDHPEVVSELYVGAEMIERSVELDETLSWGMGHTILGAYHARYAMAELEEAKVHFDRAIAINGGKFLSTKLNLATRYYCFKSDKANYERILKEVSAAGDVLPEARLQNTLAQRKARRYLQNTVFQEDCGFAG